MSPYRAVPFDYLHTGTSSILTEFRSALRALKPFLSDELGQMGYQISSQLQRDDTRLIIETGSCTLILDVYCCINTSATTAIQHHDFYVRVRIPLFNPDRYYFLIRHEHWDDGLLKIFGRQDIRVQHFDFDRRFLIQSNDVELTQNWLKDDSLKQLILKQPEVYYHIADEPKWLTGSDARNTDFLLFMRTGLPLDFKQTFEECLILLWTHRDLCDLVSGFKQKPDIELTLEQ